MTATVLPETGRRAGRGRPGGGGPRAGAAARLWRGRPDDPRWARPALLALLAVTAALYLWDLGASGWANTFYSAAVQAGSVSWKAFFFGSSDAANFITVDKPPAALWIMALSARVFGVGSWSLLVPQALMGVAGVGVLYACVRRRFGPAAGLIAGAVLAVTPVAALMFRFNNPDALLTLLLVLAGYAVLRAVDAARTGWLVLAGVCLGLAFLAKGLQAFLVLPAFALVYLVCAPATVRRRIGQLLLAGLALLVAGGWWVAVVELWPAGSRPYIGGSQDNSFLELAFGYNGFGRLSGDEAGSVVPGGGGGGGGGRQGGGVWGETGWTRLFDTDMGGQIAWLLPAAFLLLIAGLWITRRTPRTDAARAAFLLWGGWLITTFVVFSQMRGIFHAYYNVALAPGIAAVAGMGSAVLWRRRRHVAAAAALSGAAAVTAIWSFVLLGRSPDWHPWLRYAVLAAGLLAALGLLAAGRPARRLGLAVAALGLAVALAGPTAYTLSTAATPHRGSLPTAGPAVKGGRPGGGPGGRPGPTGRMGPAGQRGPGAGQMPGPGPGQAQGPGAGHGPGAGRPGGGPARGERGPMGGLLNGSDPGREVVQLLKRDSAAYTWAAAAIGSQNASGYQLATGEPIMAIGGFNGSDPAPSLARFKRLVAAGRIHYFIGGGAMGPGGGNSTSGGIARWVERTYESETADGVTLYDLSAPAGGS